MILTQEEFLSRITRSVIIKGINALKDVSDFSHKTGKKYGIQYNGRAYPVKLVIERGTEHTTDPIRVNEFKSTVDLRSHIERLGFTVVLLDTAVIENRVARLTYNSLGWVMPSGSEGKSKQNGNHESAFDYGHEEWLFDTSKILDGYHYGFLEPIRKYHSKYAGGIFNVWLYTIDNRNGEWYHVGQIQHLEVLSRKESEDIFARYKKLGWLAEMEVQLKHVTRGHHGFSTFKNLVLFNVRFKVENWKPVSPYEILDQNHPVKKLTRYNFYRMPELEEVRKTFSMGNFTFLPPVSSNQKKELSRATTYIHAQEPVQMNDLHFQIQQALTSKLRLEFGYLKVREEHPTAYGHNSIDIVVNTPKGNIFYEIKTYSALSLSIRAAIGQLMEYSYYPEGNHAIQMIIVSHLEITPECQQYLEHIRKLTNLPIYYRQFDKDKLEFHPPY